MANDLTQVEHSDQLVPVTSGLSAQDFADISSSVRFLPRIQLYGASSKVVKTGKFPVGHYGLAINRDQIIDLGESFDFLPLQVRAKAMDMSDDKNIVNVFDKNSPQFKEIAERSKIKNSSCMYGPEFLVWVPSLERYATVYFYNPTMRNSAPDLFLLLGKGATLSVRFIEDKTYGGWHGPTVTKCSTVMPPDDREMMAQQVNMFENPPKDKVLEPVPVDDRD